MSEPARTPPNARPPGPARTARDVMTPDGQGGWKPAPPGPSVQEMVARHRAAGTLPPAAPEAK